MINILVLKSKLNQLASIDKKITIFASQFHQYKLNTCLAAAEIQAFEREYKITLPQDYRNFLRLSW